MIDCTIGSVHYKALVDSGAMVNTVTPAVYDQIKKTSWLAIQNVILHPKEILKGYGSEIPIEVQCSFDAHLKITDSKIWPLLTTFFEVNGTSLSLLGYKTAMDMNLLRIGSEEIHDDGPMYIRSLNSAIIEFPKIPFEGVKFRIKEDVIPKQIIRYNIPIAFEEDANNRLYRMEAQGIIERADNDDDKITFVSPLVLVP